MRCSVAARAWAVSFAISLLASCASGAVRPDPRREPRAFEHPGGGGALREWRVLVHVHSKYSHDSDGSISDILDAAAATGSDAVIVTDHDRWGARAHERLYDWNGRRILFLAGIEYSSRFGHLVDLFPTQIYPPKTPVQELIDLIESGGGMSIVAHPTDARRPWFSWDVEHVSGLEVYNCAADLRENLWRIPGRLLRGLLGRADPLLANLDTPRDTLRLWEKLDREGTALVGIGASNTHGHRVGGSLSWDHYPTGFALMANRVWARSLDRDSMKEAFRAGRCYVAFDALGDPAGFDFGYRRGPATWIFGERVPEGPEGEIRVETPLEGRIYLYRDGELVVAEVGRTLALPAAGPGIWRVEVTRREGVFGEWFPWIISNPIRVAGARPGP